MPEKPTYEELKKKVMKLEKVAVEHKRISKSLEENEARYRQIFNIAPAGIWEVDFRTGKFVDVNDAVCEYSGYSKDELLSMNAIDVLTAESQKIFLSRTGKVLNGESEPDDVDYEIIRKDGRLAWFSISNRYIYEGGNIVGATVVARDITAKKQAAEELRRSEKKFRTLVNTAPYGIQLTNRNGKILYSNPAHHAIQGFANGALIGKYIWDLIVDKKSKILSKLYYANLIKNKPLPVAYCNKNKTKDGRLIDVQINWDYIKNTNDEVEGIISIIQDITEKKQIEEALRTSEEHLRSLMENASDFVVYRLVRDDQGPNHLRVFFVSPSIKYILGVHDPVNFESWYENIHPKDVEKITEANLKAFETLKFDEEFRVFNQNKGAWRWIRAISSGGHNEKGWNDYVNGIMIDVTDKHRAHQKLKASEKNLENKTKNLSEMNMALNALIKNMELKEFNFQEQVMANIQQLVLPYLNKIRDNPGDIVTKSLVDIVESNLATITAKFTHQLSSSLYRLTSTEIKVANLIKLGNTTKNIATALGISYKTVESHRERIRKKLGINNQKINLRSLLLSIK